MSNTITAQAVSTASDLGNTPKIAPPSRAPVALPARSPIINPTLRLDAGLGLVVIEFRNDSGAITTSIPSERQIEAYRRWENTKFGPRPAGHSPVQVHNPSAPPVTPAETKTSPAATAGAANTSATKRS